MTRSSSIIALLFALLVAGGCAEIPWRTDVLGVQRGGTSFGLWRGTEVVLASVPRTPTEADSAPDEWLTRAVAEREHLEEWQLVAYRPLEGPSRRGTVLSELHRLDGTPGHPARVPAIMTELLARQREHVVSQRRAIEAVVTDYSTESAITAVSWLGDRLRVVVESSAADFSSKSCFTRGLAFTRIYEVAPDGHMLGIEERPVHELTPPVCDRRLQ